MISIKPSSSSNKMGPAFLSTATRNYVSARLLFLNEQFYDGGIMAHEAVEKIMKAALYLKDPSRNQVKGHVLKNLKPKVESELGIDLSEFDQLMDYYEVCYDYRYPDDPKPIDFATGTVYVKLLDKIFMKLHAKCLDLINEEDIKNRSGIYEHCDDYFLDRDDNKIRILLDRNEYLDLADIDMIKEYWHQNGYYKTDEKGITKFPGGMMTREH